MAELRKQKGSKSKCKLKDKKVQYFKNSDQRVKRKRKFVARSEAQ